MQGNAVYLLAAGIVFVVVVALLLVWTSRQMRKHGQSAVPATRERTGAERAAGRELHPDAPTGPGEPVDAAEAAGPVEPGETSRMEDLSEPAAVSAAGAESRPDVEHWSAPAQSPAPSVASDELSAHFPALVFSVAEEAARDSSLDAERDESSGPAGHTEQGQDPLADRLREAAKHPAVLGWLLLDPDGASPASDQAYDEQVVAMLAALAGQAERTAQTVGLSHAREFAVRGVEGMIYLIPIRRLGADHDGYAAVFVEEDGLTASDLAHMLGARDAVDTRLSGPGR